MKCGEVRAISFILRRINLEHIMQSDFQCPGYEPGNNKRIVAVLQPQPRFINPLFTLASTYVKRNGDILGITDYSYSSSRDDALPLLLIIWTWHSLGASFVAAWFLDLHTTGLCSIARRSCFRMCGLCFLQGSSGFQISHFPEDSRFDHSQGGCLARAQCKKDPSLSDSCIFHGYGCILWRFVPWLWYVHGY